MTRMADDAKPHKDKLLWVLYLIGACCLLEVSPAWARIAADCAFLPAGPVPTDWTLPVIIEAYWGAALYGWLHDPAGQRSRRFAAGSAVAVFLLSLSGQVAVHLFLAAHGTVPPPALTAFAAALPVLVLGCGAMLVHMRRADRARTEAAVAAEDLARLEAQADAEAADERTALREQLETAQSALAPLTAALAEVTARAEEAEAARAELEPERAARETAEAELAAAQQQAADATSQAEILTRKLATVSARNSRTKAGANSGRTRGAPAGRTKVPNDVDAQAEALSILADEPNISGAKLGERVGMSERWGQLFLKKLATAQDPQDGGS